MKLNQNGAIEVSNKFDKKSLSSYQAKNPWTLTTKAKCTYSIKHVLFSEKSAAQQSIAQYNSLQLTAV